MRAGLLAAVGWLSTLPSCVPEGPATKEEASPSPEDSVENQADPEISALFRDDFERTELGDDWLALSPAWGISEGRLCGEGARNRGVWLRRRLPRAARIEFDAIAQTEEADLKVELWGDGRSGATKESYDDATGYIAIFGGWQNSLHALARLDEHADDRMALELSSVSEDPRAQPAVTGNRYRFKFERKQGNILSWSVDGRTLFDFDDPKPLAGPGHDHFAFNDWTAKVCFDNLEIVPL